MCLKPTLSRIVLYYFEVVLAYLAITKGLYLWDNVHKISLSECLRIILQIAVNANLAFQLSLVFHLIIEVSTGLLAVCKY